MIQAVNGVNSLLEHLDNYQLQHRSESRETQQKTGLKETSNAKSKEKAKSDKLESESSNTVNYEQFTEDIKSVLQKNNLSLEFSVDDNTKKMVMKVIDSETKEIIRQFPEELSLKIARLLSKSFESGQITNAKV